MRAGLWIVGIAVVACLTPYPASAQLEECTITITECHATNKSYHGTWGDGTRGGDDHSRCMYCMDGGAEVPAWYCHGCDPNFANAQCIISYSSPRKNGTCQSSFGSQYWWLIVPV